MAGGGSKTRRAGRQRGTPNKATVEKALRAAQAVADAKSKGHKLAVDVLDECMHLTMGMASQLQKNSGGAIPLDNDWDKFWTCLHAAIDCAGKLSKHQSPTFKAIAVTGVPNPADQVVEVPQEPDGKIVRLNDPGRAVQTYLRIMRAPIQKLA